ncbi:MAG TPA: ECF transporter S component [Caldisericia bacterium]|nr:ECF transporter S component [Caldisericia bacterium]HPF49070.1 ECF transporter S component [Caldisericia bacterium]HPI83066.1 ECF transporter S component [Caldisericia bacterium]HPQ92293.1 ECF transporter S component [Caldisericia bacterium]HRV74609.1 ECF transporter S component [Caldisericia bacterium]
MYKRWDARKISIIGLLSALAFVGMFVQISFPLAPFLKFDLSEIFCLLGGIVLGPISGLIIVVIKSFLHYVIIEPEIFGHVMNVIAVGTMTIVASYAYIFSQKVRGSSKVQNFWFAGGLVVAIIARTAIMIPANWLAILYTPYKDHFMLNGVFNWEFAGIYVYTQSLFFNLIQGVASAALFTPLLLLWNNSIKPVLSSHSGVPIEE